MNKDIKKQWLIILTAYIIYNLLICFLISIFVEESLLFLSYTNMLFYFVISKNSISKGRAKFISVLITIVAFLIEMNVYRAEHRMNQKNNNYSMLGIVNDVRFGSRSLDSYYIIKLNYLTKVDDYFSKEVKIGWEFYETIIKSQIGDTVLLRKDFTKNYIQVISWHPSRDTLELFQKPIKYVDGEEIGNDYYYYAKLRADNSLKHFGLNVAFKGLYGKDTILFYRNLNPSIDSVAHRLADTLQTASNRALVGDSFAFLFHDGIYSKVHVFEEIPQAKEYYLKYCKETDSATNIISDTTNTP